MDKKFLLLATVLGLASAGLSFSFGLYSSVEPAANTRKEASFSGTAIYQPHTIFGLEDKGYQVHYNTLQRNQHLGEILGEYGVSGQRIAELASLDHADFNPRRLRVNQPYAILESEAGPEAFVYFPNQLEYVVVGLTDTVSIHKGLQAVDTVRTETSGVITYSLYESLREAEAGPLLVNALADVYAWEIDFFGLQPGDAFKVVYETYRVNGEYAGFGGIKAAWFQHLGEPMYAIPFDQGEGEEYFDLTGESLRKTFLKAPLNFSRISSHFSYSRMHPVLKYRRPHLGVDYAAPRGTPVVAVGDGVVTKANYSGGAGHMVKIKHNANYTTAYLHLSRYGKGISPGTRVKQGQVIGYVGSTGLSTGPHLDFRFYKNGQAVDPLKIDPPSAEPIKGDFCDSYMQAADTWQQRLDAIGFPKESQSPEAEVLQAGVL